MKELSIVNHLKRLDFIRVNMAFCSCVDEYNYLMLRYHCVFGSLMRRLKNLR